MPYFKDIARSQIGFTILLMLKKHIKLVIPLENPHSKLNPYELFESAVLTSDKVIQLMLVIEIKEIPFPASPCHSHTGLNPLR